MNKQQAKAASKARRQRRIRMTITGTAARPRLSVAKSNTSIYLQLIDDVKGVTLAAAHSRDIKTKQSKTAAATAVGTKLAEAAIAHNIKSVVFDRGGNRYTGRVKAAADGARAGGLEF